MIQFGGHHLGLDLTISGEQRTLAPSHTGAQPAVYELEGKTVRPLGRETDKAFALLSSLDETQRKQAILGFEMRDLVLGPGRDGQTIQPEGIKGSDLTEKQREMLLDLASEWIGIMNETAATAKMDEVKKKRPRDVVRLERPDGKRRRGLLPCPGTDGLHRIRATKTGRRPDQAHSHDLPRPHE